MPKMWRGPSAELKAARSDPLYAAIARRAGRQGISFMDEDVEHGCSILVSAVERAGGRCGTWFKTDLGRVSGADPILVMLWASHAYTDPDEELFALHLEYVTRELEKLATEACLIENGLFSAISEFMVIFE